MATTSKRVPKRMSLRSAVNAFCKDCIYDKGADGGWRQQIAACTSNTCPLYSVRPGAKKGGATNGI